MKSNRLFSFFFVALILAVALIGAALLPQSTLAADTVPTEPSNTRQPNNVHTTVIFSDTLHAPILDYQETELQATVPIGTIDGNVFVQTADGMSNGASFEIGTENNHPFGGWTATVSGTIEDDTTWDTNVLVTGDIVIPAGVTLTINPGITVYFATGDDQSTGVWDDKAEITVFGTLLAQGKSSLPILFASSNPLPTAGNWGGIVIREDSTTSILEYSLIQHATYGIHFWRASSTGGTRSFSATMSNSTLQFNEYGIVNHAPAKYPGGGSSTINANIRNNHIHHNTYSGIRVYLSTGYGTGNDYSIYQNNIIEDNETGILLSGGTWWHGHVDVKPEIRNNTIRNNILYGLNIQAYGSGDSFAPDTDVQPIVENNLIQTPAGTNIRLWIDPKDDDGGQVIINPMIRYNTIADAATGILVEEVQSHYTLAPVIDHNIFYGFSAFAIDNTTTRPIDAQQNYWGNTEAAWDLGAGGMVTGIITATNHLDSTSAPVLTRMTPDLALPGTAVDIYGANFSSPTVVFSDSLPVAPTTSGLTQLSVTVPAGALAGEVIVSTADGTSNGLHFTPATFGGIPIFSGTISSNTAWDQDILVTGDVVIPAGITLTINPGVTVYFAAGDDQAGGSWADKAEIMVFGTLSAEGTPTSPISFASYKPLPAAGDWGGIVIRGDSTTSVLDYTIIQHATHGLYFWRPAETVGARAFSAILRNSILQFNEYGMVDSAAARYIPDTGAGSSTITAYVFNNHICHNIYAGIRIYLSTGYGTGNDTSVIQNNLIGNNGTGIYLRGNTWWIGHVDIKPEIRNNTIRDNQTSGLDIRAAVNPNDIDIQPIIENNLLQNPTGTNIHLSMDVQGYNGDLVILNPVIRYNTIADAVTGILIDDTQYEYIFNPTIDHNVFYGQDEYAINNTTSRTITAQQNYWGSTETEWDLGATAWVTGTVVADNHLDSASAPLLTHLFRSVAREGDTVHLFGANIMAEVPPVAAPDSYTAQQGQTLTVTAPGVLANDSDVNGDALTAILDTYVSHGQLLLNLDGSFTYTPTPPYVGTDTFTYHASDGIGPSNIVTVTLTVENIAPVAVSDSYTGTQSALLTIPAPGVLGNDSDPGGDALTVVLDIDVSHGQISLNPEGSFIYTPTQQYIGTDFFIYHASDGMDISNAVTVTLTVENAIPVAVADTYIITPTASLTVTAPGVLANDIDAGGDVLTATLDSDASHGTLHFNPDGSFTYTPDADFIGMDSFYYHATDGIDDSASVLVTIEVQEQYQQVFLPVVTKR